MNWVFTQYDLRNKYKHVQVQYDQRERRRQENNHYALDHDHDQCQQLDTEMVRLQERTCWERYDDWIWCKGQQRSIYMQTMLQPPDNESVQKLIYYYHLERIIDKLPSFQIFVRLCLLIFTVLFIME